jgi:hypothetical protein
MRARDLTGLGSAAGIELGAELGAVEEVPGATEGETTETELAACI